MGVTTQKTSRFLLLYFLFEKKTKKNFFEPHPGKEQEKGENI